MNNLLGFTDFIKHIGSSDLGHSALYIVQEGKSYQKTVSSLTAVAAKQNVKISTAQVLIVEAGQVAIYAVKVTKK